MSKWIKKDDLVLVTVGNDKGRTGKVLFRGEDRVIVQGVNVKKRHMKRTQKMQTSQIVDKEMPIALSNVALATADGKKIRPRVRVKKDGARELIYRDEKGKEVFIRAIKH